MAVSKRRRTASRDHRAVALKSARTRALMASARKLTKPVETEHASREKARARKLVLTALGSLATFAAALTGAGPSAVSSP